jgi:hypothetical protein
VTSGDGSHDEHDHDRSRQDAQAGAQEIDIQLQNALESFRFVNARRKCRPRRRTTR